MEPLSILLSIAHVPWAGVVGPQSTRFNDLCPSNPVQTPFEFLRQKFKHEEAPTKRSLTQQRSMESTVGTLMFYLNRMVLSSLHSSHLWISTIHYISQLTRTCLVSLGGQTAVAPATLFEVVQRLRTSGAALARSSSMVRHPYCLTFNTTRMSASELRHRTISTAQWVSADSTYDRMAHET